MKNKIFLGIFSVLIFTVTMIGYSHYAFAIDIPSLFVSITSPANNAVISGPASGISTPVSGIAYSPFTAIQKVEVRTDTTSYQMATPIGLGDWSSWSTVLPNVGYNGNHRIIAKVTDYAGNSQWGYLSIQPIVITHDKVPQVNITSPLNNAEITGPSTGVTVFVTGYVIPPPGSSIQKVEVRINSTHYQTATLYNQKWSIPFIFKSTGIKILNVKATDTFGNMRWANETISIKFGLTEDVINKVGSSGSAIAFDSDRNATFMITAIDRIGIRTFSTASSYNPMFEDSISTYSIPAAGHDIRIGNYLQKLAYNTENKNMYVTVNGGVVAINGTYPYKVLNQINLDGTLPGMTFDKNNHRLYVTSYFANNVTALNPINGSIITIPVGIHPVGVAFNPLNNLIYVVNEGSNSVSVISGSTNKVVKTISVGTLPKDVIVNLSTNQIYVSNNYDDTVSVISGASDLVVKTVPVGSKPGSLAYNPGNKFVYVTNQVSNDVTVLDNTGTVISTIPLGETPVGIIYNSGNGYMYVTTSPGSLQVLP